MIQVDPAPVAADPAPAGAPSPARALAEGRLAMLMRLAEIGMEIAEAAGRQATGAQGEERGEAGEGAAFGDPALAYARVARAVRMTLFLQSRLAGELAALDRAETAAQAARNSARRTRLHRLVDRALAEDGPEDEALAERLSSDAWERLTDAADDAELEGLSFAEVVGRICGDLGLAPEWTARLIAAASENAAHPREGGDPGVLWRGGADAEKAWVLAGVYPRAGLRPDPGAGMSGSRKPRAPPPA